MRAKRRSVSPLLAAHKALHERSQRVSALRAHAVARDSRSARRSPGPRSDTPRVACRAWIACQMDGTVIGGHAATRRLPVASLTKVATASVVLRLCPDARALDEEVVVSEMAAAQRGTSAGLQANDKFPVRDLLFAMMLPSGNDAAFALSEHFNERAGAYLGSEAAAAAPSSACFVADHFCPPHLARDADGRPLQIHQVNGLFVRSMNRLARTVGAMDTTFLNPHGMDQEGHASTARDVALITAHAMTHPVFRDVASTRAHSPSLFPQPHPSSCDRSAAQSLSLRAPAASPPPRICARQHDSLGGGDDDWARECAFSAPFSQLPAPGGPLRLRWANTNRMLGLRRGCLGVKTGLTRDAGACLCTAMRPPRPVAACSDRPASAREPVLVVVLGCDSLAERHCGTLRVARWAGQQAAEPDAPIPRPALALAAQPRAAVPRLVM